MTHVLKIEPAVRPEIRHEIENTLKRLGCEVHGSGTYLEEPTFSDITFSGKVGLEEYTDELTETTE